MLTCTECGRPVTYDEETKLHHCGPCIRVGERVEWRGIGENGERLTGKVTGYPLGAFDSNQVMVLWDHMSGERPMSEPRGWLRHIGVLDLLAEVLEK